MWPADWLSTSEKLSRPPENRPMICVKGRQEEVAEAMSLSRRPGLKAVWNRRKAGWNPRLSATMHCVMSPGGSTYEFAAQAAECRHRPVTVTMAVRSTGGRPSPGRRTRPSASALPRNRRQPRASADSRTREVARCSSMGWKPVFLPAFPLRIDSGRTAADWPAARSRRPAGP